MAESARRPRVLGRGVAVAAVCVLVFVLLPLLGLLFATTQGDVATRWSHLQPVVFDRLVNSIVLAASVAVVATLIGVPLAVALHRTEFPGRRIVGFLYVLPLLIPPHIHGISWMRILGNQGYVSGWFVDRGYDFKVRSGFLEVGGDPTFYPGATWLMVAAFWPFAALLTSAGFSQLDPRFEESALVSVGRRRAFRGVTLKLLRPHILVGAFFVFMFAIGCYAIPSLLDTKTIMQEIWFPANNVDVATAAVVALPLVAATVGGLIVVTILAGRRVLRGTEGFRSVPASLRRRSWGAGLYCWGVLAVTGGWPLGSLIAKAGPPETYRAVWGNVYENITASLKLASLSALALGVAGTLIAMLIAASGRRRALVVEAASLLPFAFPAIVVGVAINLFWSRFADFGWIDRYVYNGPGIAVFAFVSLFLPFAVLSVKSSLMRLSPSLHEAAALTGRSGLAVFGRITLPLIRHGIAAAVILGFVLALGELPAGMIVCTDEWQTVEIRIFNMIHFARDEEVAALCVIIAALAIVPMAIYALLFNRKVEVL